MLFYLLITIIGISLLLLTKWLGQYFNEAFWIFLIFYFNPGGIFSNLPDDNIIWRIKYYDLFFALMMISWYVSGYWKRAIKVNYSDYLFFTKAFGIFLLYFVFVYGIIVPSFYEYPNVGMFFQKHRQFIYGFPLFISIYHFTCYKIESLFKPLAIISLATIIAFFVTILTGINLVPVTSWSRFAENDRIAPISYGLSVWFIPFSSFALFLGINISQKNIRSFVLGGLLMLLTIILTLTRREYIKVVFIIIATSIISRFISKNEYYKGVKKLTIGMVLLFIILISIFPKYINFVQLLIEDIQNSLNPQAKEPEADYRVTGGGDLIIVKDIIANHPLFGIGYYPVQWSQIVDMKNSGQLWALALDASSEVPIYGSTMRLGIIGLVIPAIIHVKILFTSIKSLIKTKANIVSEIKRPSELLLYLTLILHVFSIYSIDLPSLFSEYYSGYSFIYFSSCVGILLGLKTRMDAREINHNNKHENRALSSSQA